MHDEPDTPDSSGLELAAVLTGMVVAFVVAVALVMCGAGWMVQALREVGSL